MLLRSRASSIDSAPVAAAKGYEHISSSSIAVIRWLGSSGVDYVLVGPVARAIRGEAAARGPVAIVPAPYGRNLERLANALNSVHARERAHGELIGVAGGASSAHAPKLRADAMIRPERWPLRCGEHELDVEGRPAGSPSYQELLYDSVRFEVSPGVAIEVAAPEDIEHYDQVRRTGHVPEIVVTRL
jgi:hypothetical protein